MSRCTAPVRGHKSVAACPACRHRSGYRCSYDNYSSYSSSGNYVGSTKGASGLQGLVDQYQIHPHPTFIPKSDRLGNRLLLDSACSLILVMI